MSSFKGRKSRNWRGVNNRRWSAFRLTVLKRDGWKCQACGRYGNEVDHKRPLDRGGAMWDADNCQCLCRFCHIEKTRQENGYKPSEWDSYVRALEKATRL